MKKFLYTLLAVATLGLAAGCQREQSVKEEGPAVDVAFNVSLKGLQTKAFSDGTQAKDLYVAVYANRTEGPVYMESLSTADQPDAFANGLTTTVKFRLVRGENYNIAFWAQAPNAPYTLDKAAGTLTVNTEGVANDEIRDAFYCVWSGTPSATPQDVELRRPFAQINVLTTVEDWSALQLSQIPFAGSSAKVTAPSVLNLITGEATAPKEYDLSFGAIDPEAINIPGYERAYKYVAMNYVLAGTRSTTDLSFSVYRAEQDPLASFDVPNIPYQRNWRTIVWGDIFTMEGEFNVTIDPAYEDGVDWPMDGIAQTLSLVPGSALAAAAQMDDNNIWHVSLKKDAKLDFTGIESDATGATVDYKSSNPEVGGFITNTAGEFTALKAGETTVTASFTADGYKPAAMTFVVTVTEDAPVTGDTAAPATFALDSNLGLENGTEMTVLTSGDVTLTPGKGTNNNAPKYYTTGDAVRFYGSNTLTVSGGEKLIKSVKFTYSQAPTADNPLNADSGDMTADWVTWTGSAKSVTFTVGGTSGQVRISKVEVNTENTTLYTVEFGDMEHGSVSLATPANGFAAGETVTLSVVPDDNYELDEETLTYNTEGVDDRNPITKDATGAYSFTMPASNVTVYARFKEKTVTPAANDGSQAHPFTVAEVRDFIDGLKGAVSENEVYVAGKIASIANNGQFSASFGNASFFISDDGQASSDQFEAYRVLYLGRKKWVEGDATIKVGDDVVICGKVKLYSPSNGDPVYETHQSNADNYNGYLYSLNGQTEIVNTTPVITASDISGVSADGATNATAEVTVTNVDNTWTLSATGDGTVVTSASWDGSTLSYTVSANTGAARQGKITLKVTKGDTEISKEITVSQLAGTSTLGEYESNVSWEAVDACYTDNKITVNGTADVANLKFGTSNKFGKANITLPPGTTKVTFYAVAWKGNPATMKFTVGETAYSFNIAANDGATNTAPYTLNVSATDDKYTLTLNAALTVQTVVTVETCAGETYSGKRAFLFGVQAAK